MIRALLFAALAALAFAAPRAHADAPPLLDPMFQDHAVLQRDRPIAIWGQAEPRARVTVSIGARSVRARADAHGAWRATLPALPAGGPHVITARTATATQTISDVLVGDVFLCSGQSNMEWSVGASLNGRFEAMRGANERIRLMNIAHADSPAPLAAFKTPVSWSLATPESVGAFSGACYFMARDLQRSLDVPLGLIQAAWGGANAETWIGASGLRAAGGFDQRLDLLALYARDARAAYARMGAAWESWWRSAAPDAGEPWAPGAGGDWRPLPEPMRNWKTWGVPELVNHNGMVWFRRTVALTEAQAAQAATLSLGAIDEVDQTWVNGTPIANSFGWSVERHHAVPPGLLRAGDNSIVVNVLSTWDMGGMFGPPENMRVELADGSSVPLGGEWRYALAPAGLYPPRAPWESVGGLTSLYNAMIAPIGPYGLRAAAWYQGESNTGAADAYAGLLAALMQSWRDQFGAQLPFLIVQLPNFGAAPTAPVESGWANLREAQRRAVAADPRAALVVTIDVGDNNDLHPANKQAVGARLARAARSLVYGEAVTPSGPRAVRVRRDGNRVVVDFADVEGALVAISAGGPIAFELCGAAAGACRYADARIDGASVILHGGANATRVRHCWGDGPLCNLRDGSGLPAGPFELAIE